MKINGDLRQDTLYNLGAFDTIIAEDDNSVTIQRQTGYVNFNNIKWGYSSTYANWYTYDLFTNAILPPDNNSKIDNTMIASNYSNFGSATSVRVHNSDYGIESSGAILVYNSSSSILPEGSLQYKLATACTETVIKNQPINTLDQNGSQWVNDEYNKSLNLWSFGSETVTSTNANTVNRELFLQAGTYCFSCSCSDWGEVGIYNVTTSSYIDNTHATTKTFTISADAKLHFYFRSQSGGTSSYSNIMLNKGSMVLAYQPFSGGPLMHAGNIHTLDVGRAIATTTSLSYTGINFTIPANCMWGFYTGVPYSNAYVSEGVLCTSSSSYNTGTTFTKMSAYSTANGYFSMSGTSVLNTTTTYYLWFKWDSVKTSNPIYCRVWYIQLW